MGKKAKKEKEKRKKKVEKGTMQVKRKGKKKKELAMHSTSLYFLPSPSLKKGLRGLGYNWKGEREGKEVKGKESVR